MLHIEAARSMSELEGKPRPERRIVTVGIEIPTGTARSPDRAPHPLLYLCIKSLLDLRAYFRDAQLSTVERTDAIQDIGELALNHKHHRIVSKTRIRAN